MMSAVQGDFHATQQGVGLVEVLVALLLLAVAALGYSALQARSIGTTDEAIMRTQAQIILGNAAERIRTNSASTTALAAYQTHLTAATLPTVVTCSTTTKCTPETIAKNDVVALRTQASAEGIRLGMVTCPGTVSKAETKCLIAAWNDTHPIKASADSAETPPCIKEDGTYFANADCVYMEAY